MGKIFLKNIKIYSNHGCMDEEERIGSDYIVNVELETDLVKAAGTDRLSDTVDYVAINGIVKRNMQKRSKLLEHVAARINDDILAEHSDVKRVKVKVSKLNPPINGDVEEVAIEMEAERNRDK